MARQNWIVIPGVCSTPGAEGTPTYGVQMIGEGRPWTWLDVDLDPAVAQLLADRLNRLQPEPCHFTEMVLDFIEERATVEM